MRRFRTNQISTTVSSRRSIGALIHRVHGHKRGYSNGTIRAHNGMYASAYGHMLRQHFLRQSIKNQLFIRIKIAATLKIAGWICMFQKTANSSSNSDSLPDPEPNSVLTHISKLNLQLGNNTRYLSSYNNQNYMENEDDDSDSDSNTKLPKWNHSILPHLKDTNFLESFKDLLTGLDKDKTYACFVTLFNSSGSNYLSLGPQFLVTNHPKMDIIMNYLNSHYDRLLENYNIHDTNASIIKIKEVANDFQKFDQFFFDQMDTDPIRKPHVASGPIMDALFFPYINMNTHFTHEHAIILEDSDNKVIFVWKKFAEWFIVEYDRVTRKGIAFNKDRNIKFEDTIMDDYISRNAMGFQIVFNPKTENVITFNYQFKSVDKPIKPLKVDNPMANEVSKNAFIQFLTKYRDMNPDKIKRLNIDSFTTPLTPSHLIGTIDCETIGDQISDNIDDLT